MRAFLERLWVRQEIRIALVAVPLFTTAAIVTAIRTDAYHDVYPPSPTVTVTTTSLEVP